MEQPQGLNYAPIFEGAVKVFMEKGFSEEIAKTKAFEVVDAAALIADKSTS